MKKIFGWVGMVLMFMLLAIGVFSPAAYAERFEDQNVSVTTKLPPQYLGYKIVEGTTTEGTEYKYYKITAVVTGIGETVASPVTTVPLYDGGMTSTNSLRILWAPVNGATSYNLYKSVDNTSFYLLTNSVLLTYLDEGATLSTAFTAATPLRGGHLKVENTITVGTNLIIKSAMTQAAAEAAAITAGTLFRCTDCTVTPICYSSGTIHGLVSPASLAVNCD